MTKERYLTKPYADFFKALSDPTRLSIIILLVNGELCVCQIEAALGIHQAKISRHLAYLRKHGIVKVRSQWKWKYYSLTQPKTHFEESVFKCLKERLQDEKSFKLTYGQMKKCLTKPLGEIAQIAKKL